MDRQEKDNEIRARLAADDSSALDMIWDQYASDLLGYLVSLLGSRHNAEDAATGGLRHHRTESVVSGRNAPPKALPVQAVPECRSEPHQEEQAEAGAGGRSVGVACTGRGGERGDDQTHRLETALTALPEKQRSVLVLKHYRGKTLREIGELLGISENTAGSRYRYGMEKLRDHLQEITP